MQSLLNIFKSTSTTHIRNNSICSEEEEDTQNVNADIKNIFSRLSNTDLASATFVCRRWRRLANKVWADIAIENRFGIGNWERHFHTQVHDLPLPKNIREILCSIDPATNMLTARSYTLFLKPSQCKNNQPITLNTIIDIYKNKFNPSNNYKRIYDDDWNFNDLVKIYGKKPIEKSKWVLMANKLPKDTIKTNSEGKLSIEDQLCYTKQLKILKKHNKQDISYDLPGIIDTLIFLMIERIKNNSAPFRCLKINILCKESKEYQEISMYAKALFVCVQQSTFLLYSGADSYVSNIRITTRVIHSAKDKKNFDGAIKGIAPIRVLED